MKKSTIIISIIDILTIIVLFIIYGPISNFRDWFITTALKTGHHQYFANVLYSDKIIIETLKNNVITEFDSDTDASDINFDNDSKNQYDSIYEQQILERDKDALYKLIEINEKDYSGYLVAIYDSSNIDLVTSKYIKSGGQTLDALSKDYDALVAINASGFVVNDKVLSPAGTTIQDGKIVSIGSSNVHGGGLIGFNKDGVLVLTTKSAEDAIKDGIVDAMSFGPFLIVNGKSAEVSGNGGWGYANRTAIAQRKDGIVLFLVIDGRGANGSAGISIKDMISLFEKYGAYNAANLDGGGSSTLTINHKIINEPRGYNYTGPRYLPNAWILRK